RIHEGLTARPADGALLEAREHLWRGQANDAYWHGVFGGCYLPHLRRAVRSSLIAAEARLVDVGALPPTAVETADLDADGRGEVRARTPVLSGTIDPAGGGGLTELAYVPAGIDLADVLTRRREAYHRHVEKAERPASATGTGDGARSIHERWEAKE